jgi:hypothetical protein
MKAGTLVFLFLFTFIFISGCDSGQTSRIIDVDPEQIRDTTIKDGEQSIYYDDGKLKYLVEFKNGKANGRVRQFYGDGKLYMKAVFKDGHRHGKCTYFFKNGKAYSVSNYVNGSKEGIETKYYEDGKILSENTYKQDKVQPGLKEYKKDGTLIKNDVKILISEVDHSALEGKYFLRVSLSNPRIAANFYSRAASEQVPRQKLKKSGNTGIIEFNLSPGDFIMKKLIIDAEYKTSKGNAMRLQRTYNVAID